MVLTKLAVVIPHDMFFILAAAFIPDILYNNIVISFQNVYLAEVLYERGNGG